MCEKNNGSTILLTSFSIRMEEDEEDILTSEWGVSEETRNVSRGSEDQGQRNKFLDAEEYKKVVASLLPAWKRDRYEISNLCSSWPQNLGPPPQHEGSSTVEEQAAKKRCTTLQGSHRRDDSGRANTTRVGEYADNQIKGVSDGGDDDEYGLILEAEEAMNIPALPYPRIEGVPEDVIKSIIKTQKRCGACEMCKKDKGHRNFKCQALGAVIAWEKEMGAIDGALVFQIAQKLGEITEGHGMRQGKGLRCGRCKTCCAVYPDKMCLTTIAVRDGTLPERLKPAALGISSRKNTLRSVADPFSVKPTGFQMLKDRFLASDTRSGHDEIVEYKRWGMTNLPYHERNRVKDVVQKSKKKIKFQKKWKCLSVSSKGKICGKTNREGVKVCHYCKSPRWLGPAGQLESRVAAILDRGVLHSLCQGITLPMKLREIILKEHGNGNALPDECVSLEAIQDALNTYKQTKDSFKADLERRTVSLRLMYLQDIMDADVLEAGKAVKDSAFGKAVTEFEDSLMGYVRQRGALKHGTDTVAQSSYSVSHSEDLKIFVHDILREVGYILHSMYGFIDMEQKLGALKSCLLDWGTEPDWLDALKQSWKCPMLRTQMAIIVSSPYMFTIKSMLAHFIHCIMRKDKEGVEAGMGCSVCAVDHSMHIPSWRTCPILVQMSDRMHDITPRVLDEDNFCVDTGEEDPVRSLYKEIRYPMYRLVEATLNEAALCEASERIPVKQRPNPPSRFIESTRISSFPALPVDGIDWYEKESMWLGETPEDDLIARCIPDGKVDTNEILCRIVKKKKDGRNKRVNNANTSTRQASDIQSAFLPYSTPESQPEIMRDDPSAEHIDDLMKSLPQDVQFVFRAAQKLKVLPNGVLQRSILKFRDISGTNGNNLGK